MRCEQAALPTRGERGHAARAEQHVAGRTLRPRREIEVERRPPLRTMAVTPNDWPGWAEPGAVTLLIDRSGSVWAL